MVIEEISAQAVLQASREMLGLPAPRGGAIDDAMLAASVRRAAGILCPCSPSTLVSAVRESLQYLTDDNYEELEKRISETVEGLIIGGDLLELSQVTTDDPNVKGTWVFAAPPSFVVRPNGGIFILGIVPDEASPLPVSLSTRVTYEGYGRVLIPHPGENLPPVLRELGLLELSESVWIKIPKQEKAIDCRDGIFRRLTAQPPSGAIDDISILDPARKVDYYPGRWTNPTKESGNYVARRPQAYGAPLWGVANLVDGVVTKFLDFPLKGGRWRGCDIAWHLEMAIDQCRGTPQLYRRVAISDAVRLDFFSPLPLWAQRRLAVLGRPMPPEKCLISYTIPEREVAAEEAFLQERLWLARIA
jgi:hypothetical protein